MMNESEFDDRGRMAMLLAGQQAQRFNHYEIDSKHILLGLVQEGSGVAANVLANLNVCLREIRLEVEKRVIPGSEMAKLDAEPTFSLLAQKIVELSKMSARSNAKWREQTGRGHDEIGTEHILLALLTAAEGVAYDALTSLGLKYQDVLLETENVISHISKRSIPK